MIKEKNKKLGKMTLVILIAVSLIAILLTGCVENGTTGKSKLVQTGSSTVLPLAMAWAEEFQDADISVSGGGSSHGINALLEGEADLGDASRIMKGSDYEKVGCDGSLVNTDGTASVACDGVLPIKWIVAYDVLAVVVHNDNTWATQLNYTQLYYIFTDDNSAVYWDEVPGLEETAPHEEIEIYAPDEASGTYDFVFEELIPKWGKDDQQANTRLDSGDGVYHPSADDNVILNAINTREYAIGYFGFAYYKENTDKVKTVEIAEEGTDYEEASLANVADYPLARPLYIYTNGVPEKESILAIYFEYILGDEGQEIVPEVGYVKLSLVDINLATSQLSRIQ
jgi:phosphate transport system substrate-binding protein